MQFSRYTLAAMDVARLAGEYILGREKGPMDVQEKLSSYDYVTDVDTGSEAIIRRRLAECFPDHGFVGEESGMDESELKHRLTHMADDEYIWVVDPLDGTVNFIHGLNGYSVSVGLLKGGSVVSGAIYVPATDEMFCAERGRGAWLNGARIAVSDCAELKDGLIACGLPATDMAYRRELIARYPALAMNALNVRMLGAAASTIAYVACGRLDGYVELGHHPWDVAAGMLLMAEAGGKMTNHAGEPFLISDPRMILSNGKIHAGLVDAMRG